MVVAGLYTNQFRLNNSIVVKNILFAAHTKNLILMANLTISNYLLFEETIHLIGILIKSKDVITNLAFQ